MSDEEKQAIEHLTKKMKYHKDNPLGTYVWLTLDEHYVRIILKLVENLQKDIESWKKYCDEQENDITLKNNKICDLEFKIEKQSKEIEELKETLKCTQNSWYEDTIKIEEMKKQIDLDNECEIALNSKVMDLENADKKWEDKIKAKIEEVDIQLQKLKDGLTGRKTNFVNKNMLFARKKALQSLLEKE